jgi:hypothetical protein
VSDLPVYRPDDGPPAVWGAPPIDAAWGPPPAPGGLRPSWTPRVLVLLAMVLVAGTAVVLLSGDGEGDDSAFCAQARDLPLRPAVDPVAGEVQELEDWLAELGDRMGAIEPPAEIADDWGRAATSLRGPVSDDAAGDRVLAYLVEHCGISDLLIRGP